MEADADGRRLLVHGLAQPRLSMHNGLAWRRDTSHNNGRTFCGISSLLSALAGLNGLG